MTQEQETSQTFMRQADLKLSTLLSETTLNFARVIGNHDISAVAGIEVPNNSIGNGTSVNGVNVPDEAILNFQSCSNQQIFTVSERDETRVQEKVYLDVLTMLTIIVILASVSLRRDGDSRFGFNKRYETFPAVSLGWNIHNEAFP